MQSDARQHYLETQIMTATPQKLRLMLIEGAIRMASQTIEHWRDQRAEDASATLVRCRAIISELLGSIKPDGSELASKSAAVYTFLFQWLTVAHAESSTEKIEDVIRVLEFERETWRQVCEQMPEAPQRPVEEQKPKEITANGMSAIPPGHLTVDPSTASPGVSLDA